jgi:TrkA domain protein
MTVYETDVPGVGKKFELDLSGGARAVVLLHHDGRVEVFRRESPDADSEKVSDLRNVSGVSVLAVQRGSETVPNPQGEFRIEPGDILVALGTREQQAAFAERCR